MLSTLLFTGRFYFSMVLHTAPRHNKKCVNFTHGLDSSNVLLGKFWKEREGDPRNNNQTSKKSTVYSSYDIFLHLFSLDYGAVCFERGFFVRFSEDVLARGRPCRYLWKTAEWDPWMHSATPISVRFICNFLFFGRSFREVLFAFFLEDDRLSKFSLVLLFFCVFSTVFVGSTYQNL